MFIHHANSSHGIARSTSGEKKMETLILYFTLCHSRFQIFVANGRLNQVILYCINSNEMKTEDKKMIWQQTNKQNMKRKKIHRTVYCKR